MLWLLDLDGVVWLSGRAIPGAAEAIARLRAANERVAFLTNNSGPTVAEHVASLRSAGVDASSDEVLTSAHAAASLLDPGSSAAVVGGAGVVEALIEHNVRVVPLIRSAPDTLPGGPAPQPDAGAASEPAGGVAGGIDAGTGPNVRPDAVVVGRTTDLSYGLLAAASEAIRSGARFVATNSDATMPTPGGPVPGAGAIVAFIQVASGRSAEVAGKPHKAAAAFVRARLGPVGVVVGDRPETDGQFARAIGTRFALVLTGVTSGNDLPVEPSPDVVGADLASVVDQILGPAPVAS